MIYKHVTVKEVIPGWLLQLWCSQFPLLKGTTIPLNKATRQTGDIHSLVYSCLFNHVVLVKIGRCRWRDYGQTTTPSTSMLAIGRSTFFRLAQCAWAQLRTLRICTPSEWTAVACGENLVSLFFSCPSRQQDSLCDVLWSSSAGRVPWKEDQCSVSSPASWSVLHASLVSTASYGIKFCFVLGKPPMELHRVFHESIPLI